MPSHMFNYIEYILDYFGKEGKGGRERKEAKKEGGKEGEARGERDGDGGVEGQGERKTHRP